MNAAKVKTERVVLIAATLLCVYHTLHSLINRHLILPKSLMYIGYGLVILFTLALLVYVWDVFRQQHSVNNTVSCLVQKWKDPIVVLPAALFLIFFISALLTEKTYPGSLRDNRGCLFDAGISFFALLPLGYWFGLRRNSRFLCALIDFLTVVYVGLLLVAFYVIHSENSALVWPGVCIVDGRFRMGSHPNTTGMYCVLLMMTGLYRFLSGNSIVKILYVAAEAVLFIALSLTDSRASILALVVCIVIFVALCIWKEFRHRKSTKRILISVALAILAFAIFWFARNIGHLLFSADKSADGIAPQVRRLLGDRLGAGSGRVDVWIRLIRVLPDCSEILLHGCAPYSISDVMAELVGTVEKFGYAINTHNQFLEVLMAYGLPALVCFFCWLVVVAHRSWTVGMANSFEAVSLGERVLPLVLLLLIINNMFETTLLFYRYATGNMFFLIVGYVSGLYRTLSN